MLIIFFDGWASLFKAIFVLNHSVTGSYYVVLAVKQLSAYSPTHTYSRYMLCTVDELGKVPL